MSTRCARRPTRRAYRHSPATTTFSTARGGRAATAVLPSFCPGTGTATCDICSVNTEAEIDLSFTWNQRVKTHLLGFVDKPVGIGEKPLVEAMC